MSIPFDLLFTTVSSFDFTAKLALIFAVLCFTKVVEMLLNRCFKHHPGW